MGALLSWLVAVPLLVLVVSAFKPTGLPLDPGFTTRHVTDTYGNVEFWALAWTTIQFAVGSTALAMMLGGPLAWLVERTDLPAREFVRAMIIIPMAMPPFLLAFAWVMLLSPRTGTINRLLMDAFGMREAPFNIYSVAGMIFVEALSLVPSVFLLLAPSLRNVDRSLEESALTSGAGFGRVIWKVTLPCSHRPC